MVSGSMFWSVPRRGQGELSPSPTYVAATASQPFVLCVSQELPKQSLASFCLRVLAIRLASCTWRWCDAMDFFDFSQDMDGDDGLEDLFEPVLWQPAQERTDLSSLLHQPSDRLVGMLDDGTGAAPSAAPPLWDPVTLDPVNLLRRAVFEKCPELYVAPQVPRRRRSKGDALTPGETLYKLQSNPTKPGLGIGNSKQRKAGFEEYVRILAEVSGVSRRDLRSGCRREWAQVPLDLQKAWHAVSLISQSMYSKLRGAKRRLLPPPRESLMNPPLPDDSANPFPEILDVYGVLCTWNTAMEQDSAELRQALENNLQGPALVSALSTSAVHLAVWHAFSLRVQSLARSWGFPSWACCMEVSTSAQEYGRVHLHAFLGQQISPTGWPTSHCQYRVRPEQLRWDGRLPDMQVMKNTGKRSADIKTVGGLYYCLAKKQGSLFRAGHPQPFKDWH